MTPFLAVSPLSGDHARIWVAEGRVRHLPDLAGDIACTVCAYHKVDVFLDDGFPSSGRNSPVMALEFRLQMHYLSCKVPSVVMTEYPHFLKQQQPFF